MSPQQGPDLVGAGYPTSNALTALLGGTSNGAAPNVPVASNLYFTGGVSGLTDVVAAGAASVNTVAVPVVPGTVISKLSVLVGGTPGSPASGFGLLHTGTGSAPGTAGAAPTLIATSASTTTYAASATAYTFSFATPQTITSIQAPYGYIYASFQFNWTAASPTYLSTSAASAGQYPWFATSPFALYFTSASVATFATLGTATRAPNPPVVLLY